MQDLASYYEYTVSDYYRPTVFFNEVKNRIIILLTPIDGNRRHLNMHNAKSVVALSFFGLAALE